MSHSQDPDDLWGDAPIARIEITCRRNGSMSVAGSIDDLDYAKKMLDKARDTIQTHHARKRAASDARLIIPSSDVGVLT